MKKILLILTVMACTITSFGQGDKNGTTVGTEPCPAGWCAYWQYTFTTFNFHKPRTDCKTGFGLCLRGSSSSGCKPCTMFKTSETFTKIEDGKAICYAELKNGKLELHIPSAIQADQKLSSKDIANFSIDRGTLSIYANGKQLSNKEGTYAVTASGSEFVVLIDVE